jgi:hypothetical protein
MSDAMTVVVEPTARVSSRWTVRLGLLWFGYWTAT